MGRLARLTFVGIRHVFVCLGYKIRPYDMLSDSRRWFWVPPTCCRCGKPAWKATHSHTEKKGEN